MTPRPDGLDAFVRAFKDESAGDADGRATRARILARAGARARRAAATTRALPVAVVALVIGSSASAGVISLVGRWRAPEPVVVAIDAEVARGVARGRRGAVVVPAAVIRVEPPAADVAAGIQAEDAEAAAYARAHRAHFAGDSPGRALAAWTHYLAKFPRGLFVPEAQYNRALCLLKLGRAQAARAALRPFAAGAIGRGYRQGEAQALLDWLD